MTDAPMTNTRIYTLRGQAVMLDSDLAEVFGVTTGNLNKAVDRNPDRFPSEFAFRLSPGEWDDLIFQIGTSRSTWGGRRKPPRVFTEHGTVMLASVLNSAFAVQASIQVVNAFVRLRHVLSSNKTIARRIDELAAKVDTHDRTIAVIFHELRKLTAGPVEEEEQEPKRRIGFRTPKHKE